MKRILNYLFQIVFAVTISHLDNPLTRAVAYENRSEFKNKSELINGDRTPSLDQPAVLVSSINNLYSVNNYISDLDSHNLAGSESPADTLVITEHFPIKIVNKKIKPLKPMVLNSIQVGEKFGFSSRFKGGSNYVNVRIELTVPHSPEKFPTPGSKSWISKDQKTVIVLDDVNSKSGYYSYAWGLDPGDPTGLYGLKFYLDDLLVGDYSFNVTDSIH